MVTKDRHYLSGPSVHCVSMPASPGLLVNRIESRNLEHLDALVIAFDPLAFGDLCLGLIHEVPPARVINALGLLRLARRRPLSRLLRLGVGTLIQARPRA